MSTTGLIGEVLAHNTPADNGQIVYDDHGKIVRESFGRPLSVLETELCNALDKRNAWVETLSSFHLKQEYQTVTLDTPEKVNEFSMKMNMDFKLGDQVSVPVPQKLELIEERQPRTFGHGL